MPIFAIKDVSLEPISEIPFNLEIGIQSMVEKNMKTIFGFEFVSTEFMLNDLRIDTLAFDEDEESKSFVILEYKRDRNFSVIDQGFAYLAALQKHKADFILLYNEKLQSH
jgi:RecB family endonuclease NucS